MNFPCAKYHSSRRAETNRIWKMRESSMKLHYRSRRNFSADTINAFDVREYHVGHDQSPKSPYPLFSNSLTIVRLPRRKRKIVLTWNEFSFARNIIPRDEQRRAEYGKCENRVWNCIIDREETSLPIQLMRSTWENTTWATTNHRRAHIRVSVFFIRTIIRTALKARKRSKSDLAVDGARLTSGNRWLEWHLKLLKGSPYRSQPFTPSPEGRLSQWTRV